MYWSERRACYSTRRKQALFIVFIRLARACGRNVIS